MNNKGLGLYVHWPFCLAKCPYCDFNSIKIPTNLEEQAWQDAYLSALHELAKPLANQPLLTIYFGGGTPSLMPPETVEKIIDTACKLFNPQNLEITLEVNPETVNKAKLGDFFKAGINRISLGIQALNDKELIELGRPHNLKTALTALDWCREIFPRVSLDLIYARSNQTLKEWESELKTALDLGLSHYSFYQLTLEEHTPLAKRKDLNLPDEETAAEMFSLTREITAAYGVPPYEISNYAKIGEESRHNLGYWRGLDYLGIGAGAHGRITIDKTTYATMQEKNPSLWLKKPTKYAENEPLTPEERAREKLLLGLRMNEGLTIDKAIDSVVDKKKLGQMLKEGFLHYENNHLCATSKAFAILDYILEQIIIF